jgi:MFS family permease
MEKGLPRLWTGNFTLICLANFLMGFAFYLLMPTLPFFITGKLMVDKSLTGAVLSSYVIAALSIRPLSGFLVDTFSRKAIYIVSYFAFVGLFLGYPFAESLLFMVWLRIMHGFTWGTMSTSGNTLAIDIMPSARRGEGIGYFGLASTISMALGPLAGMYIMEHFSFNPIFYTATFTGAAGLATALLLKVPARPRTQHSALSLDRFILVKGIPIAINTLLFSTPYGMMIAFAAMYGKEWMIENTGMFFTCLAIGIGASRIYSGRLIDRGKVHAVSTGGLSLLAISFLLFSLFHSPFFYFLSAFLIGAGYGTIFPAFLSLFVSMVPHNQRGTANSTWLTAFDLGIGIGMILAGKIAEILNLSSAFGLAAILSGGAVIFYRKVSKASFERNKLQEEMIGI